MNLNGVKKHVKLDAMDWRQFSFEYRLSIDDLISDLIRIEAYREAALNLVLPPDWKTQLDQLNRVRAVHGTTAPAHGSKRGFLKEAAGPHEVVELGGRIVSRGVQERRQLRTGTGLDESGGVRPYRFALPTAGDPVSDPGDHERDDGMGRVTVVDDVERETHVMHRRLSRLKPPGSKAVRA